MGERGPVPAPDSVRARRGNPGNRAAPERVKATPGAPNPPTWLDREAMAEWRRVVPDLDRMGVLAKLDRAVLAAYCAAWSKFVRAEKILNDEELVAERRAGNGPAKHPAWQVWREAGTLVATLAKEIFSSPNARLRAIRPEGEGDDEGTDILD